MNSWSGLGLLLVVAVGGCKADSGPSETDAGCSYETCSPVCRAAGTWYRGCDGGLCRCSEPADAGDGRESASDDSGDEADLPPCDGYRVPVEVLPGASPGVTCRRLSTSDVEESLLDFAGDGRYVAFRGTPDTSPLRLWLYERDARCISLLDGLSDLVPDHRGVGATYPSVDGQRIAYVAGGTERESGAERWQIRLVDVVEREPTVIREFAELPLDPTHGKVPFIDGVVLRYPWIVWRESREANGYAWYAYAYNIETGEERNLSRAPAGMPADESGYWRGVVHVDLFATTAVFDASWGGGRDPLVEEIIQVDVATGAAAILTTDPTVQFRPTITPSWVAWLDQRPAVGCDAMSPCRTDVYGLDRETGAEHALVTAPPSMQGPWMDGEGDWLLYEDQRDGADVTTSTDREQDMYAFHLPTRTEVRVTDWPGFEMYPKVYDRHDGTFGALLIYEIDYGGAIYRLWDCDLPVPTVSGGG